MFLGTIPASARPILHEIVRGWETPDLAVGCSGNFTIERTMADLGIALRSCDVSLYSYALGSALSHQPVDIKLSERGHELAPWAGESFRDADSAAVAMMLLLDYAPSLKKPERIYSQHVLAELARTWPAVHGRALAKFREKRPVQIESYVNGDVRQFIASLPDDTPFMSFPPFYKGGYEKMFQTIGELVEWPAPSYQIIDDNAVEVLLEDVRARCERWCIGLKEPHPPIHDLLRGVVERRGAIPMYIYASEGPHRYVAPPARKTAPIVIPSLDEDDEITAESELSIVPVALPYFEFLRARHLSRHIATPASPTRCALVMVDGKVAGAFGISDDPYVYNRAYLMSDFAVSRHGRLSKLVLYAALSREAQLLMQQTFNRRKRALLTTAFSEHPTSMKYRGLFKLVSRKPAGGGRFQLNYQAPTGQWTLKEGLAKWMKANR